MRLMNLYHFGMAVIALIVAPFFLLNGRGRFRLLERFGFWKFKPGTYLWLHGASLGEVSGLQPVVSALKQTNPEIDILITSSSSTGVKKAETFADNVSLIPFDSFPYYSLALKNINISALVISETELWPGLIDFAQERQIPVQMINAQISDYTVSSYNKMAWLFKPLLSKLKKVITINEKCSKRFVNLGVPSNVISIAPNTKYDRPRAVSRVDKDLKNKLFGNSFPIFTIGCLRPGEEKIWFPVIKKALKDFDVNIIIAPRHKDKFDFFASGLSNIGINFSNWTELNTEILPEKTILYINTYGVLETAYSISLAAFVGGTLVDIGGHNPLEPAAYGSYLFVGPYVSKIEELISRLESDGACARINNQEEAYKAIKFIVENENKATQLGELAKKFYEEHQGASKIVIEQLGLLGNA